MFIYLLPTHYCSHPFHHPASQSDISHPHLSINQSVSIISGPASQTTHTHTYPSTSLFPSSAAQPVRHLTPTLTHQPVCFHHQRPSQSDNSHPHLPINQSVSIISGPASQTTQPTLTHQPVCFHHQRPSQSDNSTHTYPSTNLFPSPEAQPVRHLNPHIPITQSVSFTSGPAGTVDGIGGSEYARFCWRLVKLTDVTYFLYQLTGNAPQPCHHSLSRQVIIMSCQLLCDGVYVNCHVMSTVT